MPPHSECAVIRCSQPAEAVRVMSLPGHLLLEEVVCVFHDAAMDAGEPWFWVCADDGGRGGSVIYMGDDLARENVRTYRGSGFIGTRDRASGIDEPHTRFTIAHADLAGGDEQRLDLLLTGSQARELGELLIRWAPSE